MKKNTKNICILFGAGAEIPLGLDGGADFSKAVVGYEVNDINEAITKYYKSKKLNEWYPEYSETSLKASTDEINFIKACLSKKLLEENEYNSKKDYEHTINKEYENIKNNDESIHELISKYASYTGIIDKYFYTLINPKALGPKNFWKVIQLYTRAYLFLSRKFLDNKNTKEDYLYLLDNPHIISDKMKVYFKNIHNYNYYNIINELKEYYHFKIATTNYTTACENIAGISENDIAYVHGKFGWFENPRNLQVIDISKEDTPDKVTKNNDVYFPYIFVQSGIKPIVDEIQIKEYAKMIDFFENSEKIFIIGYRANYDDNHINSIIRSAICKNKEIIYFIYEKDISEENIKHRLRLDNKTYNNLKFIKIDHNNCISIFRDNIENS